MKTRIALLAVAVALPVTAGTARAASGTHYLLSRQTPSGGFAESGSGSASGTLTEWAVMGLRAAGVAAGSVHRSGGATATAYLAGRASGWRTAYSLERGILAVVAAGHSPTSFAGRNLIAALRGHIGGGGRIGPAANSTYWGILALRAAGFPAPAASVAYVKASQRSNGGYSWSRSAAPDSNDTAAAVLALHAASTGCRRRSITRAYGYLAGTQTAAHGYSLEPGGSADSQSTSWAIQARHACGLHNRRARTWLLARQLPSGAFNYQPGRTVTPAFVTAQVLPAVHGRWYPIR